MEFRRAKKEEARKILEIIDSAKDYFKNNHIDQWQNGYPNLTVINDDIEKELNYVLIKDSRIVATAVISFCGEETYDKIYNGKWIIDGKFAVIHRIAVSNEYKGNGFSGKIIKETEILCKDNSVQSIRIDTHRDNIAMQKSIKKSGFEYCGIIYDTDESERLAFEKVI